MIGKHELHCLDCKRIRWYEKINDTCSNCRSANTIPWEISPHNRRMNNVIPAVNQKPPIKGRGKKGDKKQAEAITDSLYGAGKYTPL